MVFFLYQQIIRTLILTQRHLLFLFRIQPLVLRPHDILNQQFISILSQFYHLFIILGFYSLCFMDAVIVKRMDLNSFPFFLPQFISFYLPTDSLWQLLNKFYLLVSREENQPSIHLQTKSILQQLYYELYVENRTHWGGILVTRGKGGTVEIFLDI